LTRLEFSRWNKSKNKNDRLKLVPI
jgi:hypothetical protein